MAIFPGASETRSMVSSSTGGNALMKTPRGPKRSSTATSTISSRSGISAHTHRRASEGLDVVIAGHLKHTHPPQLGKLTLVRVEHEAPRVWESDLQNCPFGLTQHDRVRILRGNERRARAIHMEEVPVDMYGVDGIELCHVDQVDAHELVAFYPDRMLRVVEGYSIDGIDFVLTVEVGIERVHHHDQLPCRRPALPGVDDEHPVQPFVDVALQRQSMTMVLVQPERDRVELVGERPARWNLARADARHPIHLRPVDAVEVHGVGVGPGIDELNPHAVALADTQRRPRDCPVEGPGREENDRGKPGRRGGHSQTPHDPDTRADELAPARIGDIWNSGHIRAETPPATYVGYPRGQSLQKCPTHVGSPRC